MCNEKAAEDALNGSLIYVSVTEVEANIFCLHLIHGIEANANKYATCHFYLFQTISD